MSALVTTLPLAASTRSVNWDTFIPDKLVPAIFDTLYMVSVTMVIAGLLGLIMGEYRAAYPVHYSECGFRSAHQRGSTDPSRHKRGDLRNDLRRILRYCAHCGAEHGLDRPWRD